MLPQQWSAPVPGAATGNRQERWDFQMVFERRLPLRPLLWRQPLQSIRTNRPELCLITRFV
jgi:hypothetical protein